MNRWIMGAPRIGLASMKPLTSEQTGMPLMRISQRVVRRDELPRQFILFCEFGGEGFDRVDFGGVVAAEVEVEFFLLGAVEPFFAEFAGDEGVGSGGREFGHGTVAGAAAK